jgi:hypothetical protein
MEKHGGFISTGDNSLSARALWQSYKQSSSSKARGTVEGNDGFFPYEVPFFIFGMVL